MSSDAITEELRQPFPVNAVSFRAGATTRDKSACIGLAYLDSRDIQERLDAVAGPANWSDSYHFDGAKTCCQLSIKIDGEWVTKSDGSGDTHIESEKGAFSGAFKRAAAKWGIGRYLYTMPNVFVPYDSQRKQIAPQGIEQLRHELGKISQPRFVFVDFRANPSAHTFTHPKPWLECLQFVVSHSEDPQRIWSDNKRTFDSIQACAQTEQGQRLVKETYDMVCSVLSKHKNQGALNE